MSRMNGKKKHTHTHTHSVCVHPLTMLEQGLNPHIRWRLCFTGSGTVKQQLCLLLQISPVLRENTLPFPAFGNLNFVSPPHRRAETSLSKPCPNKHFPIIQDFFSIKSVTKSSTAKCSHENLVEKLKIFVQDFASIKTSICGNKIMCKIPSRF